MLPATARQTDFHNDHLPESCKGAGDILARVGDKWSVLIVRQLDRGSMRFSELNRAIDGISKRMLTLTLRNLERDGLVERTVTPLNPPRVDYALTPLGVSLSKPVMALAEWAIAHKFDIQSARHHYDRAQEDN